MIYWEETQESNGGEKQSFTTFACAESIWANSLYTQ